MLDSGDIYHKSNTVSEEEKAALVARAQVLVQAYNKQGCNAVGIGDRDVSAIGIEGLKTLQEAAKYPFLSANIVDAQGNLVFKPYVMVEAAGFQFGIFSVVSAGAEPQQPDKYKVLAPFDEAAKYVAEMEQKGADVIVLLAHLDRRDAQMLQDKAPGIDLVLGGQSMGQSNFLETIGSSWWAEAGQKAKSLNIITLHLSEKGHKSFVVRDTAQEFRTQIENLDHRIQRYVHMMNSPPRKGTRGQDKGRIKEQLEGMMKQRGQLFEAAQKVGKADPDSPFLSFDSVALSKNLREDKEVLGWIADFEKAFPGAGHDKGARRAPRVDKGAGGTAIPPPSTRIPHKALRSMGPETAPEGAESK